MVTDPTDLMATARTVLMSTDLVVIVPTPFATATVGIVGGSNIANKSAQVSTVTIRVVGIGMAISFGVGIQIFAGDSVSIVGLRRFGVRL